MNSEVHGRPCVDPILHFPFIALLLCWCFSAQEGEDQDHTWHLVH